MHASPFDRFIEVDSPIHKLDGRIKVVLTIGFIISNVVLPDGAWLAFALTWILIYAAGMIARLPWSYLLVRSFIAIPFALAAITVLFNLPGTALASFSIGPWTFTATDAGLIRFLSILLRSWISVQAAILLVATTSFTDLIHALRHLRLPKLLVAVIGMMYRYLFVLSDETLRLLRARESRSAALPGKPSGGSLLWRANIAGSMAGQLFLRSFERSDRVYNAMLARSYQGEMLTMHEHTLYQQDWLALLIGFISVLIIQAIGWIV